MTTKEIEEAAVMQANERGGEYSIEKQESFIAGAEFMQPEICKLQADFNSINRGLEELNSIYEKEIDALNIKVQATRFEYARLGFEAARAFREVEKPGVVIEGQLTMIRFPTQMWNTADDFLATLTQEPK